MNWIESIKGRKWDHKHNDVSVILENGLLLFYDSSKSSVAFPLVDLLDFPGISLLARLKTAEDSLRYLYENSQTVPAFERTASASLQKLQPVGADAGPAGCMETALARRCIGLASADTASGETVRIQYGGMMENPDWNWTPGQELFLGDREISMSPYIPGAFFTQKIAEAVSRTKILIRLESPVIIK